MDDDTPPAESKLTRSKQRWATERKFLTDAPREPARDRLPPGQHLVRNWPVLDLGRQPHISTDRWRLNVRGLVSRPLTLNWAEFQELPQTTIRSDIHCVTTWSRYDNDWTGVATRSLLDLVEPRHEATAVMLHGYDGYTTNVTLPDFASSDAIIAHSWQGRPLTREHGGPARLIIPHLYFWKSAKWINVIEFLGADRPGFWEMNGYHMRGEPWREERYS
ncbi:sulfite oxidase-like oxidoreductase [Sphingomonas sp. IC-11]|uniref:sulfite oxidase-like oxidoreductase n=1 Tax=Sphingomonas sp. IC-11 TaxID=2898528 RepID=UPI001E3A82C3|nr:sulfite oxidase-like oxidoreductase [Sphingomonas sp. IC-11]MCD2315731.1 sulfite oxidase-like oxidoreductase [Sphingomonas sp. IC-11]